MSEVSELQITRAISGNITSASARAARLVEHADKRGNEVGPAASAVHRRGYCGQPGCVGRPAGRDELIQISTGSKK